MFVTNNIAQAPVVHALRAVFGVPDKLVDKIAEVQHKTQTIFLRSMFVLKNHSPVGVLRSLGDVLAGDEREAYSSAVVVSRRSDGSSDAASVSMQVGKSIPVDFRWLQSASQHAAGPIGSFADRRFRSCDNPAERVIFRDLDRQLAHGIPVHRRTAGPQKNAIAFGIPGGHSFRIKVAAFAPGNFRLGREGLPPGSRRTQSHRQLHKRAPGHCGHLLPPLNKSCSQPAIGSFSFLMTRQLEGSKLIQT